MGGMGPRASLGHAACMGMGLWDARYEHKHTDMGVSTRTPVLLPTDGEDVRCSLWA